VSSSYRESTADDWGDCYLLVQLFIVRFVEMDRNRMALAEAEGEIRESLLEEDN